MRAFTLLLCLAVTACSDPLEVSSEHFHIVANTRTSSVEEMEEMLERGERFHAAIAEMVPPDAILDPTIEVELHGKLRSEVPYVDEQGDIHLWRFSDGEGGYSAVYAHEIVHAIDFDQAVQEGVLDWEYLGFYSEGWAEFVAMRIDPMKTGFPFYGFNEDVVAAHWVAHGGLSLAVLRTQHSELNGICKHQSYSMRASWFRYVDEVLGRQAVLDVMYKSEGFTPEAIEAALGKPLDEVDADWREWVSDSASTAGADADEDAYLAHLGRYAPCE